MRVVDFVDNRLGRRCGFTLAELLVAVAIIGMLASMALGAFYVVREQARAARTRATIAKIDRLLMERYEAFLTRRLDLPGLPGNRNQQSAYRLYYLRELIRMEMPHSFLDIVLDPPIRIDIPRVPPVRAPRTSLNAAFYAKLPPKVHVMLGRNCPICNGLNCAHVSEDKTPPEVYFENQSAECLFMILTTGPGSARHIFSAYEIADTDGDGLQEFVDGWGRPIRFIRWAPGLIDSELQPRVVDWNGEFNVDLALEAIERNYDPFDVNRVDEKRTPPVPRPWRLVPFVYSAGPDGEYGLEDVEYEHEKYFWYRYEDERLGRLRLLTPFSYLGDGNTELPNDLGKPININSPAYRDNIHNHVMNID